MPISRAYEGPKENLSIEHNHEVEHIKDINKLQIELAIRKYPNIASNDERIMKWMSNANYSKEFRIILRTELDADTNFWQSFNDIASREALMKRIEEKLYSDDADGAKDKEEREENHDNIVTLSA